MTVESTADQIELLSDFGSVASVSGSPTITVTGIYEQQYVEQDAAGNLQYSSNQSSFYIRSEDATTIPMHTVISLNSRYFVVADIQKQQDGQFSVALLRTP